MGQSQACSEYRGCCASEAETGTISIDTAKSPENPAQFGGKDFCAESSQVAQSSNVPGDQTYSKEDKADIKDGGEETTIADETLLKADAGKEGDAPAIEKKDFAVEAAARKEPDPSGVARRDSKDFEVEVDLSKGPLGVTLDEDDGETLVITAIGGGLVQEWNREHQGRKQVTIGDRIKSVDGVFGNPRQLCELLRASGPLSLLIRQHVEFHVALIRKDENVKLGLEVRHREGGNTLLVRKVFSEGMVPEWNRVHAGLEIRVGDRAIEVNGVRGPGSSLNEKVKSVGSLIISFVRFEN